MKLKTGVILTKTDDTYVAVAAGEAGRSFNGMIKLNATAAFILEKLREDSTVDSLVQAVTDEYEVTAEEAKSSVVRVVDMMKDTGLIEI